MKKLEKTNERSLRYLKTDQQTDQQKDKGDYQGPLGEVSLKTEHGPTGAIT